jgi:hypothetical protein
MKITETRDFTNKISEKIKEKTKCKYIKDDMTYYAIVCNAIHKMLFFVRF